MAEVIQINCSPTILPDIFNGGNDDGHAMAEVIQINCSPTILPDIFNGGNDDGHAMAEVIQINYSPTILPDIFNGGNDDGHAMAEVIQINCAPAVLPDIYVGGIEDGHAMETVFVACAPNARFEADTTVICEGETLQFNDLSSGPPTSWSWTFNGGTPSSSTDQNPTVVYDTPGNYSVTLSITSDGGNSSITKTNYITVNPAPTPTIAATGSTTICDGDSVLLSSLNTYDRYQWSNGDTTQNSYTLVGGENTLTVTSSNGCTGISNPITVTIEHNPQPEILVGDTSNLCMGDVITLTSTIQSNYLWSPGGETTQSIDVTSSGTFWVTSSELNGCSRTSESITLNFGNSPSKPFITTSGPVSFCDGDSVLLTSQSADQYLWSPTNNTTQSVWVKTSGMYRVEVTNPAGCSAVSDAIEITVNPKPIANASINTPSVCVGDDVLISTTNELGVSYLWNGPNGYSSSNRTNNLNAVGTSSAGWYIVSVTLNGCTVKDSVELEVNETPIAVANAQNTTICEGEDIELTTTTVADEYLWTGPNGFTSTNQNPVISATNIAASGDYTLEVTTGTCSTTDIIEVIVNPTPIAEVLITSSTLCSGDNITFNATGNAGATYTWTGPNGFTNNNQTFDLTNVQAIDQGEYKLTVEINNCFAEDAATIIVNETPIAVANAQNTTICEGEDIELTTTTVADEYLWTGPNGFTSTNQNPVISATNIAASGDYTLEVTTGTCSTTDIIEVIVNPTPIAEVLITSSTLCSGDNITFNATGNAGATYTWTGPNGFTNNNQTFDLTNVQAIDQGEYKLTVEINNCFAEDAATIIVNETPIAVANAQNTTICEGEDIELTTTTVADEYLWTGPNGFTSTNQNPVISATNIAASGDYTLEVTTGTCSTTDIIEVIVNPTPIAEVLITSSTLCSGDNITFNATGNAGATYTWTGPNGFTNNNQTFDLTNVQAIDQGEYKLTVEINNCFAEDAATIIVNETPIAVANAQNTTICEGEDIELTTTTVADEYLWTGPNGFTSTNQNPVISATNIAASGDYTLEVTTGTCSTTDIIEVIVNPTPIAEVLITSSTLCSGDNITFNATGNAGATYTWTGPNGFTNNNQTFDLTNVQAIDQGEYKLTVEINNCFAEDAATIIVNETPIAVANAQNTTICEGEDIELTTTTVADEYLWTGPNGFTSTNQNPVISATNIAASGDYTLEVTTGTCSTTDIIEVIVNPTPIAEVLITSSTLCSGDNITFNATGNAGATYTWTGPNGFTNNNQTFDLTNVQAIDQGEYKLTVEINNCFAEDAATIIVNETPIAVANAQNTTICEGEDIELTTTTVADEYLWTGPNGFTSTNQNPVISATNIAASGDYTLEVTTGVCSTISTVTVIVNPTPIAEVLITSSTLCSGDNITFNATGNAGATYTWTGPNGFTNSDQNPEVMNVNTVNSGWYIVTVSLNSCTSKDSVELTVEPALTVDIDVANTTVCEGEDILLSTTSLADDYLWTGPNGFTSINQNATRIEAETNASGYYILEITSGSCSNNDSVEVTINATPVLSISGSDITCYGDEDGQAAIVATGNAPFFYSWSSAVETSTGINGLSAGTYTVVVEDVNECVDSASIVINEPAELIANTTVTETQCNVDDGIATVNATGGNGNYSYLWMPSGQTTSTAIGLGVGSYTVLVTDAKGCDIVETVVVNSVDGPVLTISNFSDVSCFEGSNGSASVSATGGSQPYTYNWSPSGGTSSTANNVIAGDYVITVTDNSDCASVENVVISEPDKINVISSIEAADCGETNGSISLNVTGGTPSYSYNWLPNGEASSSLQNISGGVYQVIVSDDNGCSFDTVFVVPSVGEINVQVLPQEGVINKGESIVLSVNVDPSISNETYNWTPSTGLSCTQCPNPIASPIVNTQYTVEVTTPDNCSGSGSSNIIVIDECAEIYIPDMFSPNDDGENDEYCIYGDCISTFYLQIFNRWGEMVYVSDNPENCWDGTFKGKKLNTDVFAFKLSITTLQGEKIEESGNINLFR